MYFVRVTFEGQNIHPIVLKDVVHGQTLLELLLAGNIEVRHECGGVCSCTTCHVHVKKGMTFIEEKSRREEDFIRNKIQGHSGTSRLSCQSLILDGNGEIEIVIPDYSFQITNGK
jgi:2Fe-2S ferredoxin